jgi:hypothetical protein
LTKIGAKIVRHGRSITFQMAAVMVSRGVFQHILDAIAALGALPPARCRAPQSLPALTVGRGTAFMCRSTQRNLRPDGNHGPVALAAGAVAALSPLQRPSDGG